MLKTNVVNINGCEIKKPRTTSENTTVHVEIVIQIPDEEIYDKVVIDVFEMKPDGIHHVETQDKYHSDDEFINFPHTESIKKVIEKTGTNKVFFNDRIVGAVEETEDIQNHA